MEKKAESNKFTRKMKNGDGAEKDGFDDSADKNWKVPQS